MAVKKTTTRELFWIAKVTTTTKINEEAKQVVAASVKANIPVLLIGETGTGKTTMVKEIATEQNKVLVRLNLNGETGTDELLGKYILRQEAGKSDSETIWIDGPMLKAIKEGHRLLLDEINAALPEVLLAIQALAESNDGKLWEIMLPEKEGEVIVPHEDFRLFATANPAGGAYWGTKDFNSATLSRFNVLYVNPLPQQLEKELLTKKFPELKATDIHFITDIGIEIRQKYFQEQIFYFCSTRDLVMVASLFNSGLDMVFSIKTAIVNKIQDTESKKKVEEYLKNKIKDYNPSSLEASIKQIDQLMAKIKQLEEDGWSSKEDQEMITNLTKELNNVNMQLSEIKKKEQMFEKMKENLKSMGLF